MKILDEYNAAHKRIVLSKDGRYSVKYYYKLKMYEYTLSYYYKTKEEAVDMFNFLKKDQPYESREPINM